MTNLSKFISRFVATLMMFVTLGGAVFATSIVLTPSSVQAQASCPQKNSRLPDFGTNCIKGLSNVDGTQQGIAKLIQDVANFLIFVLAAISVLFIVYGGFLYVTDDGSGTKAGQGKKIVLQALIGLIIAVVSFTLVSLVVNFVTTLQVNSGSSSSSATTGGIQQ
jgi:uncharacterized membrane protein